MDTLSELVTAPSTYTERDRELDLRWWAAANYLTVAQIYLKANPLVRVEVIVAATPPDLFEQQIDISFQSGNIPDSTLVARRITTARWHLCAAPSYLKHAGVPKTPDELAGHQCLNFLPGSFRSRWLTSSRVRYPQSSASSCWYCLPSVKAVAALAIS